MKIYIAAQLALSEWVQVNAFTRLLKNKQTNKKQQQKTCICTKWAFSKFKLDRGPAALQKRTELYDIKSYDLTSPQLLT